MKDMDVQYRFKPTEQERAFPVTSLTDEQICEIYNNTDSENFVDALVAIANAAIKQYILDMEKNNG